MTHKNSRLVIFIHLLLILVLSFLLAVVIIGRQMVFVPLTIILLLLGTIFSLVRYLEKTTNELTRFLLSIREGAFADESHGHTSPKNNFSEALNDITREFARVAMEKELQFQYLKTLNENIGAGIISVNADDTIRMINPAAKQILGIAKLSQLADLKRVDPSLHKLLSEIGPEQSELFRINSGNEEMQLSVRMKEILLRNENVKIFLLHNINTELGQKEIEAWQQLTRVLTHEIMNSVTPIAALSKAAQSILRAEAGVPKTAERLSAENLEDIDNSIATIASRSDGLLKFVSSYRAFTRPLVLTRESTELISMINRVIDLLEPEAERHNVIINFNHPGSIFPVKLDVALMEQVFINLIKNGIESCSEAGGILSIELSVHGNMIRLVFTDNGSGIDEQTMSKIFVPFFTTKAHGTGIGLSLARQILMAHRGIIKVRSTPGEGSAFILEWKQIQ
jgi:two-component system nitrogen regulation sensor histidine kinase NtrY